jgi:hypothetical protein
VEADRLVQIARQLDVQEFEIRLDGEIHRGAPDGRLGDPAGEERNGAA